MEMNQMAAPEAMMARGNWRCMKWARRCGSSLEAARENMAIIRKIGSAKKEMGIGPMREKRLARTVSQPEPAPHPGMAEPLSDFASRNAEIAAARTARAATMALR